MKRALTSATAGIAAAASMPHAGWTNFVYDLTPYTFILLSLSFAYLFLFLTSPHQSRVNVFICAWAWSFGYFLFGLSWVGNALLVPGNDYAWAWPLALIGLPFMLAPFLAVAMTAILPLVKCKPLPIQIIVFTLTFTIAEYARGHLFTGFPWILPGMFWAETLPVFQILSIIGIYGLTLLTIFWATTIGLLLIRRFSLFSWPVFMLLLSVIPVLTFKHQADIPAKNQVQVVMVQANIPQSEKWDRSKQADHFFDHLALSERSNDVQELPTMIIWPETTLSPNFLSSQMVTDQITAMLAKYPANSVLITGVLRDESTPSGPAYYNSVAVYDQSGHMETVYDKHHLVPFGEYIPFQRYIPLAPVTRFEGLKAGTGPKTVALPGLPRFSPLVCYEVIFTGQTVARGPIAPQLMVNVTNDGWYGNSPGPYQHLMEARARAIERNMPLIRVAGTGISAMFDAYGHKVKALDYNLRGNAVTALSFR